MAIHRPTVNVALSDGTDHENVRINVQDQLQWSRSARANGWKNDDQILMLLFLAWHALKRQGLSEMGWDEFSGGGAEWVAENPPSEDAPEDPADPTSPAA